MKNYKRLEEIYNEINIITFNNHEYDILLDNHITNEKIEHFLQNYSKICFMEAFSEGNVEEVFINKSISHGTQDQFKFIINNIEFYVNVFYYDSIFIADRVDYHILKNYNNVEHINHLRHIRGVLNKYKDKKVCYFDFRERNIEMKLTGKVKEFSYTVLGSVSRAIRQSFRDRKRILDVNTIYYLVSKEAKEQKRLEIYKKLIGYELSNYNHTYVDAFSDDKNYIVYHWKDT